MIALDKKTGINLKKGSSIKLEKNGAGLKEICVGLNWGAIEKKGFFNKLVGNDKVTVDLDGAVTLFSGSQITETIYYRKLYSKNGAIKHSGDDLTGDLDGDDGLDNEIITIDLSRIESHVDTIFVYLNSFKGQDFGEIPYSKVRIFEGSPDYVKDVLATFNLSVENKFKGYVSMVMGRFVRNSFSQWKFEAIGDAISPRKIEGINNYLQNHYFNS